MRRLRAPSDSEDAAAGLMTAAIWNQALPHAPKDLLDRAVFRLTADEAQFIIDRLVATQPTALLTLLAREGIDAECDHIWTHPHLASFPAHTGRLVRHGETFSHVMHGAALLYNLALSELRGRDDWAANYRALGVDYTFVCFGIEDARGGVQAMRTLGIRGRNVTMPHKQAVIPHLDALDDTAREIGAVNTINNLDGHLTGYNTDCIGAIKAIKEASSLDGRRVALLGAGGAARAIAWGMRRAGATVTVFNRTAERGQALAYEFGMRFGGAPSAFDAQAFDGAWRRQCYRGRLSRAGYQPSREHAVAAAPVRYGRCLHSCAHTADLRRRGDQLPHRRRFAHAAAPVLRPGRAIHRQAGAVRGHD
jgi:hypothetical protein